MERLDYPYEPEKKFGINFEEIFQRFEAGEKEGVIFGGSGRKIHFDIDKKNLTVTDYDSFEARTMSAIVIDSNVATFYIQTRISEMDGNLHFPWERHPDMFAGKFVALALDFFKRMGIEIEICRGEWGDKSDNYATYKEYLDRTGNKIEAVKNTWSGRTFAKHGFTRVEEKDIREYSDFFPAIEVKFHRAE